VRRSFQDEGHDQFGGSLFSCFANLLFIVTSCRRKKDGRRFIPAIAIVSSIMAALSKAIRRLFPPLKVKSTLWVTMAILTIYGLLVGYAIWFEHLPPIEWGAESTVVNGLALGFLIGFRNQHAYDRWWEARKLWGQLINENRNLCLKVRCLGKIDDRDRAAIGRLVVAFAEALKDHLRRRDGSDEAIAEVEKKGEWEHQPSRLAGTIVETVGRWQREGHIDGWGVLWLDGQINSFMNICGACERIRNTPLSSSYRALLRHGIALYLIIAPFYLIGDTGIYGLPMFILAAYFLLGIELVAEEIEEPFGAGGDNLPLERYCATIARSVNDILGTPIGPGPGDFPPEVAPPPPQAIMP
jgi:putative membrane protein